MSQIIEVAVGTILLLPSGVDVSLAAGSVITVADGSIIARPDGSTAVMGELRVPPERQQPTTITAN